MTVPALDQQTTGYTLGHAYWLGKTTSLAYKDESEIQAETAQWGFDRFEFFYAKHQLPFPLEDTQAYVVASDRMIIAAFRGTEPSEIRDWLSDANTPVIPGPSRNGLVHLGFNQALASIYPEVRDKIKEFRTNNQTLWFTGHSLGGALAMLAAARMHFEDPKLLADGVYTFGQPRTCDHLLARAYDSAFKSRVFRFVNNNDIVPQAPPEPVFHHVKAMMYFDADGKLHEEMSFASGLMDRFKGLTADMFAPGTDGIRDHSMNRYLENLEKNLD
ncbi:MAG: lipase family protein [Pseudonocardiaceae bacterium]